MRQPSEEEWQDIMREWLDEAMRLGVPDPVLRVWGKNVQVRARDGKPYLIEVGKK